MGALRTEITLDWNRQHGALKRVLHLDTAGDPKAALVPVSMQR